MPFTVATAPKRVRRVLPQRAVEIWTKIWNSSVEQGDAEQTAFAKAWAGIKRGFKKGSDGIWVRKNPKTSEEVLEALCLEVTYKKSKKKKKTESPLDEAFDKPFEWKWADAKPNLAGFRVPGVDGMYRVGFKAKNFTPDFSVDAPGIGGSEMVFTDPKRRTNPTKLGVSPTRIIATVIDILKAWLKKTNDSMIVFTGSGSLGSAYSRILQSGRISLPKGFKPMKDKSIRLAYFLQDNRDRKMFVLMPDKLRKRIALDIAESPDFDPSEFNTFESLEEAFDNPFEWSMFRSGAFEFEVPGVDGRYNVAFPTRIIEVMSTAGGSFNIFGSELVFTDPSGGTNPTKLGKSPTRILATVMAITRKFIDMGGVEDFLIFSGKGPLGSAYTRILRRPPFSGGLKRVPSDVVDTLGFGDHGSTKVFMFADPDTLSNVEDALEEPDPEVLDFKVKRSVTGGGFKEWSATFNIPNHQQSGRDSSVELFFLRDPDILAETFESEWEMRLAEEDSDIENYDDPDSDKRPREASFLMTIEAIIKRFIKDERPALIVYDKTSERFVPSVLKKVDSTYKVLSNSQVKAIGIGQPQLRVVLQSKNSQLQFAHTTPPQNSLVDMVKELVGGAPVGQVVCEVFDNPYEWETDFRGGGDITFKFEDDDENEFDVRLDHSSMGSGVVEDILNEQGLEVFEVTFGAFERGRRELSPTLRGKGAFRIIATLADIIDDQTTDSRILVFSGATPELSRLYRRLAKRSRTHRLMSRDEKREANVDSEFIMIPEDFDVFELIAASQDPFDSDVFNWEDFTENPVKSVRAGGLSVWEQSAVWDTHHGEEVLLATVNFTERSKKGDPSIWEMSFRTKTLVDHSGRNGLSTRNGNFIPTLAMDEIGDFIASATERFLKDNPHAEAVMVSQSDFLMSLMRDFQKVLSRKGKLDKRDPNKLNRVLTKLGASLRFSPSMWVYAFKNFGNITQPRFAHTEPDQNSLSEAFNNPLDFDLSRRASDSFEYVFEVDKGIDIVSFERVAGGLWAAEFVFQDGEGETHKEPVRGSLNQIRALSTLGAIVQDFIRKAKPSSIQFAPATPQLRRIYIKMANGLSAFSFEDPKADTMVLVRDGKQEARPYTGNGAGSSRLLSIMRGDPVLEVIGS